VTGVPTHTRPAFAVVSGKVLEYALVQHELEAQEWLRDQLEQQARDLESIEVAVARARLGVTARR
jgi:hypothetical protein